MTKFLDWFFSKSCTIIFISIVSVYLIFCLCDKIVTSYSQYKHSICVDRVADFFYDNTDLALREHKISFGTIALNRITSNMFMSFENYGVTVEDGKITSYCMYTKHNSEVAAKAEYEIAKSMMQSADSNRFHILSESMCIIGKNSAEIDVILSIDKSNRSDQYKVIMLTIRR